MALIESLHRDGATVIMVTHNLMIATRAQREIHILDGQKVDVAEHPRLSTAAAPTCVDPAR